ncbi:MAG: haloalkane dehalogenase [Halioglobus sp.]
MTVKALRTADERFSVMPGFSYQPHYVDDLPGYESLRMAYIDEGPSDADTVFLCLHGEPTWSYLYRKMIPVFTEAGCRVIAPDLFGFGRSDKPIDDATYTFNFHRNSVLRLIERLDLTGIALVCQDWGGILGLTMPMDMPERFTRLLVMNTAIPTGAPVSEGFALWKGFAGMASEIPTGGLVALDAGDALNLFDVMAYDAPFPDNSYKAGVRRFPQMVPVEAGMEGADLGVAAREYFSTQWDGQAFMAIGMRDNVLNEPVMMELKSVIKGCSQPMKVAEGGHFVQEFGEPIAREALKHFGLAG